MYNTVCIWAYEWALKFLQVIASYLHSKNEIETRSRVYPFSNLCRLFLSEKFNYVDFEWVMRSYQILEDLYTLVLSLPLYSSRRKILLRLKEKLHNIHRVRHMALARLRLLQLKMAMYRRLDESVFFGFMKNYLRKLSAKCIPIKWKSYVNKGTCYYGI